jgi:hypothetical protein
MRYVKKQVTPSLPPEAKAQGISGPVKSANGKSDLLRLPMIGPIAVAAGFAPCVFAVLPRLKSHGGVGDGSVHSPRLPSLSSCAVVVVSGK